MQVTAQSLHLGGLKDPSMRIPQVHRKIQFSYQVTCYMWTSLNGLKYSRDKEGAEAETVDQLCTSDWEYKRLITKLSSKNYMLSNFFWPKNVKQEFIAPWCGSSEGGRLWAGQASWAFGSRWRSYVCDDWRDRILWVNFLTWNVCLLSTMNQQ